MLSAEAYSFRQKSRLAISLSWIAGYTNVVTLLLTGHVISHMSGNTTVFSSALGARNWEQVKDIGAVLVSFLLGAAFSGLMTETARRRGMASKYVLPIGVQAILLALLAVWMSFSMSDGQTSAGIYFALFAAFAMGLQNATITHISGAEIRTTHVTGVITDLGLEGIQFLIWWRDKMRSRKNSTRLARTLRLSRRHPTFLRLLLLASILGSFGFGAMIGTILLARISEFVMVVPVCFLLWIIVVDWRHPISDVRELDLLADPELQMHGLVRDLLPSGVGIYRITSHHDRERPPHFRAWAQRIPRHWQVIILALSPITHLTDNAVLDLLATAEELRSDGRMLIIANSNVRQFQIFKRNGVLDELGPENILPDLEFAIARALTIHSELQGVLKF
jgi:uncharacterized membrane protein YoaK (UPF0700 family)